jgi:threonine dehydrogenase-like Zn-dependent dehydrogenase
MKAAVFYEPRDIRMEEIADPTPGPGEIIIEVAACGICGSDLEYFTGGSPLGTPSGKGPLVLGHELSGTVVALGAGVTTLKEGDRVAVNPVQGDPATDVARSGNPNFDTSNVLGTSVNGGLAKYVRSRADGAHRISEAISFEQGASAEMLASAVHSVTVADIGLGDFVVIYGPGPVGLAQVQLAKLRGARVLLVGTRDYRLEVGRALGADFVANTAEASSPYYAPDLVDFVKTVNRGRLADRAILATSSMGPAQEALAVTGEGAVVVYMGLAGLDDNVSLPLLTSLVQAKTIRFSWLYPYEWPRTLALLEAGMINTDALVTHSLPLGEVTQALSLIQSRDEDVLKVVLRPE